MSHLFHSVLFCVAPAQSFPRLLLPTRGSCFILSLFFLCPSHTICFSAFHTVLISYLFKSDVMASLPKQTNRWNQKTNKFFCTFSVSLTGKWEGAWVQPHFLDILSGSSAPIFKKFPQPSVHALAAFSKLIILLPNHCSIKLLQEVQLCPQKNIGQNLKPPVHQNVTLFRNRVL